LTVIFSAVIVKYGRSPIAAAQVLVISHRCPSLHRPTIIGDMRAGTGATCCLPLIRVPSVH
jgi:hypothetical protein